MDPDKPFREWWPEHGRLIVLWEEGRLEESRALLVTAQAVYPNEPAIKLALARQSLAESGDAEHVDRARQRVSEAIELAPDSPSVRVEAAATLLELEDIRGCAEHATWAARRADELHATESQALLAYLIGRVALWGDKRSVAEESLRLATTLDPNEPMYAAALAKMLLDDGQRSEARAVIEEGLRHRPNAPARVQLDWSTSTRRSEPDFRPARRRYSVRKWPTFQPALTARGPAPESARESIAISLANREHDADRDNHHDGGHYPVGPFCGVEIQPRHRSREVKR